MSGGRKDSGVLGSSKYAWSKEKVSLHTSLITSPLHLVMHVYQCQLYSKSYGHCSFGVSGPQNPCTWQSPASLLVTLYPTLLIHGSKQLLMAPLNKPSCESFLKRYRAPAC